MSVTTKSAKYEEDEGRQSKIQHRAFVITRNAPSSRSSYNVSSSYKNATRQSISPQVYQQLSSSGIIDFKGTREKEKRDLQSLNERLASYIERVHYLDAQCKRLEAENEALRNRKVEDLKPIRDAYENELAQARSVIDELSSKAGKEQARIAGLQDEIAHQKEYNLTLDAQNKDLLKKLALVNSQLGEIEGDLHSHRRRIGSLEDENAKLRELLEKVQEHNRRLRADLDSETAAHIEADCLAQTKAEEAEFYRDLLDQLQQREPEPVLIKGMDYADFWKSELAKCVREIQSAYDEKIDLIQQDCESKYSAQINTLRAGNVKDGMQLQHSQEEVKKLRGQIQDSNARYAELATKLSVCQGERDELARQLAEIERDYEEFRLKYNREVTELNNELQSVLQQLSELIDAKMSLELEIACYKKLLEGEESRTGLRSLVEEAIGVQGGRGTSSLKEAIQQSTSSGSMTIQRSSKGAIGFATADQSGANIVIENTTSGARAKSQDIAKWRLQKTVNGKVTVDVTLNSVTLQPGQKYTLWAKGAKDRASSDNEQIADAFSFGVGSCVWTLLDDQGSEKATLTARFSG